MTVDSAFSRAFSLRKNFLFFGSLFGLALVSVILWQIGLDPVVQALRPALVYFPLILLCELAFCIFGVLSQRALYGDDWFLIPKRVVLRGACMTYAIMGLIPMGRLVGESARAMLFSKYIGSSKAASVAVQVQVVVLLVGGFVGLVSALLLGFVRDFGWLSAAVLLNGLVTLLLGLLVLLLARHVKISNWLKKLLPKVEAFQDKIRLPVWAIVYEILARMAQILQNGILVCAVGGALGIVPAFFSEAMHLLGATLGDLVPGQLGVTELVYSEASAILHLKPQDALSIALLAHLAQLFWVVVALLTSFLF